MILHQDGKMIELKIDDIIIVPDGLAIVKDFHNDYCHYSNYPPIENYIKYASSFTYYEAKKLNIKWLCTVDDLLEKYPEKLI